MTGTARGGGRGQDQTGQGRRAAAAETGQGQGRHAAVAETGQEKRGCGKMLLFEKGDKQVVA